LTGLFCGDCGRRLTFSISTGNGGRYPYYFCSARINKKSCGMRTSINPKLIEEAIQRYYREKPIQLSPTDVAKRTAAIESLVAVSSQAVEQVREAKTSLIVKLRAQQGRLIRLHAEEGDAVSPDAFREERVRMQTEIEAAEESLAETERRLTLDAGLLRKALELAEDVAGVYAEANEQTKRGYNQAFFKKIYVTPEWDEAHTTRLARISGADLTEPYAAALADNLVEDVLAEAEAIKSGGWNAESGPEGPLSVGSNFFKLAEGEGFEPPSEGSPPKQFSRLPHSTTLPPLRARATRTRLAARAHGAAAGAPTAGARLIRTSAAR
jgi:hypothetical protein